MSLSPCCPYHPAGTSCRIGQLAPCHVAFIRRQKIRLPDLIFFRGHFWVHFRCSPVTRSPSLTMALSVGFTSFVFSTDATQAKGLLTFTPIGLPPIEHVCLSWTHCLHRIPSGHSIAHQSPCNTSMKFGNSTVAEFWRTTALTETRLFGFFINQNIMAAARQASVATTV
jgi:hypothetical protein